MTTARVAEVLTEAAVTSAPRVRDAEVLTEAVVESHPKARVADTLVEVVVQGPLPKARLSRESVEALTEGDAPAQVSRVDVEALAEMDASARVSRVATEALIQSAVTAQVSRYSIEVLLPNLFLYPRTADDTVSTPTDAAAASIAFTARYPYDDAPVAGDTAEGVVFYVRSGADTASVTDEGVGIARRLRTAGDTVPTPTDAATYTIHHLLTRTAADTIPEPLDTVISLTRPAAFTQPTGGEIRFKRVVVNEARSYLTKNNVWSSDVPVSRPVPYEERMPVLVDMGGFGFTAGGIVVNVSEAEEEENFSPHFAPEGKP